MAKKLEEMLDEFWNWLSLTPEAYITKSHTKDWEEYMYPGWEEMLHETEILVEKSVTDISSLEAVLTFMAADNEREDVKDTIIDLASDRFVEKLVRLGTIHYQPDTRWQCAEIIRVRRPENTMVYMTKLMADTDEYVSRRAGFTLEAMLAEEELDPAIAPGEGFEWKGKGGPGSKEGTYYCPQTGQSRHPDIDHPAPIGLHWDYNRKGSGCKGWREYLSGRVAKKSSAIDSKCIKRPYDMDDADDWRNDWRNDWRIMGQEGYLLDKQLLHIRFDRALCVEDFDQCEFCWAVFDKDKEHPKTAYFEPEKKVWVCEDCFRDFQPYFLWTVEEMVTGEEESE